MTSLCDDSCCGEAAGTAEVLRELGRFSQAWTLGPVLGEDAREVGTRVEIERRIASRAEHDPPFREELLRHPRWVLMVALGEAFGLSKMRFLRQVREVRILEETPQVLFFVVPIAPELEALFLGEAGADRPPAAPPASLREEVERRLADAAGRDGAIRQALLFQPQDTYLAFAREQGGGELPGYLREMREVRVVPETATSLALVLSPVGGEQAGGTPQVGQRRSVSTASRSPKRSSSRSA